MGKMEAAAKRGVKIRFLLEKVMLGASEPKTIERLKKIPGLELRVLKFGDMSPGGIIHAKFFIVDGQRAYVGSQNFDWRSLKHIHETGLAVSDPKIAGQAEAIFRHDWRAWALIQQGKKVPTLNRKPVPADENQYAFLVASPNAYNPKGIPDSETELPRLLGEAKKEIRIQLLDFTPLSRDHTYYAVFDNAVRAAHARGVRVKLMVSHWNTEEPGIDYLKSLAVLPGVEVRIVTIPKAKEGPIPFARVNHSKFMSIDDKIAWVGTSNWSGGYMDKTRNLEIVIHDEKLAKRITALHEQLWSSPYAKPVDISKEYPRPDKTGG
jgi:phosphatidylserine/phosphatidylglycerophosphate/cardiolipin synthase-like enzyme